MCDWVQGYPTVAVGRVVAKEVGRGRVGRLVHRYTYDQAEEEGHSGGRVHFEESQEHGCSYDTRQCPRRSIAARLGCLTGLGDGDGEVVAGIGSVRGELGVKDFSRVGYGAQFGLTGLNVVVDARFAVATH